jgi:hypothetical protein
VWASGDRALQDFSDMIGFSGGAFQLKVNKSPRRSQKCFVHKSVSFKFTMQKGEEIIIHSGVYVGSQGWLDPTGSKMKTKVSVIVAVDDGDGNAILKQKNINKSSMILKKNKKAPATLTEELLEDQPQLKKDLNTVAKNIARLGIIDGKESAQIFLRLVTKHIDALKKKGPKANYYPLKIEEGMYRTFYDGGPGKVGSASRRDAKRGFEDRETMSS